MSFCRDADSPPVPDGLQQVAPGRGLGPRDASVSLRSSSDSRSPGDLGKWGEREAQPASPGRAGVSVALHCALCHRVKIRKY